MCKYDIEVYYKVTYNIMATLYYYHSIIFSCVVSVSFLVKSFIQTPHLCLWFSCTTQTCLPIGLGLLNVLLQRSHLETMSGSNECDTLEKNYAII